MIRDPRGGHNRKKLNEDFFKVWSQKMAYVLGFMYADGSLLNTNKSSRTYYLMFANNDLDLLTKIRMVLKSDHKIYIKPPHVIDYKNRRYLCKTGYVLRIGNKVMCEDLVALGMPHKKSNIMVIPNIPKAYFSFFVRGYFDGDGCVSCSLGKGHNTHRLRVLFTSGSEIFLSQLSQIISKLILDYMYSDLESAPYIERKYQKYLDYKNNLMGPRVKRALVIS